jgi:hypothetical protein
LLELIGHVACDWSVRARILHARNTRQRGLAEEE